MHCSCKAENSDRSRTEALTLKKEKNIMAKYNMSQYIKRLDNFIGWIFIRTVTKETAANWGTAMDYNKQFPGLTKGLQSNEVDIELKIQGVEVDFVKVMEHVHREYLRAVAEDSKELARSLISKKMESKINLIQVMLEELESIIAKEIPEEELNKIREWYSDE